MESPALPQPPSYPHIVESPPEFPLHTLPPTIRTYIESSSAHARVPPELIVFPFLALVGGVIGNRLRIQVNPNWFEYPTLWIALVAPTGTGKSPAIRIARQPFDPFQKQHYRANRPTPKLTMEQSFVERLVDLAAAKTAEELNIPAAKPTPVPARVFTNHIATDLLTYLLEDAPGITILRDELIGLVRMFNRRGGDERQRYLSLWSSESITTISAIDPDLWVRNPVVSIVGGLQPLLVNRLRSRDQDGMLERFLTIHAVIDQRYWNQLGLALPDPGAVTNLIRPLTLLSANQPDGAIVERSSEATLTWASWFNDNVDRGLEASDLAQGFYAKLPAHVSRLALVLHALSNPEIPTTPISAETMQHAIELGEFVRNHIHGTLRLLGDVKPRRSSTPLLSQTLLRAIAETREPEGWISRNQLRIAVGNPSWYIFDIEIENLINQKRIESTKDPATKRGRPRHLYRALP